MNGSTEVTSGASSCPPAPDMSGRDVESLREVIEQLASVVDEASSDARLIDRMTALVALRNTVDAAITTTEYSFARVHTERMIAAGQLDPEQLERSIGTQVGYANRVSSTVGRNRMRVARDLYDGLAHVRGLYAAGQLTEQRATIIAKAAAHLDGAERSALDRLLVEEDLPRLPIRQLKDLVARLVAEIAPDKFRDRAASARTERRGHDPPGPGRDV